VAGIDFKTPFDDDSATFHDGPLERCFRMRKWMFATAFSLTVLGTNWLNYGAATKAFNLEALPKQAVQLWLTIAGFYLLAQFVIFFRQIVATYEVDLRLRIAKVSSWQALQIETQLKELYTALDKHPADGFLPRPGESVIHVQRNHDRLSPSSNEKKSYEALSTQISQLIAAQAHQAEKVQGKRIALLWTEFVLDAARVLPYPVALPLAMLHFGYLPPLPF
jgi:hypothetical protein